jgi:hypothetical protein
VNSLPFQNRRAAVANTRSSTVVAQPLRAAEAPR